MLLKVVILIWIKGDCAFETQCLFIYMRKKGLIV